MLGFSSTIKKKKNQKSYNCAWSLAPSSLTLTETNPSIRRPQTCSPNNAVIPIHPFHFHPMQIFQSFIQSSMQCRMSPRSNNHNLPLSTNTRSDPLASHSAFNFRGVVTTAGPPPAPLPRARAIRDTTTPATIAISRPRRRIQRASRNSTPRSRPVPDPPPLLAPPPPLSHSPSNFHSSGRYATCIVRKASST